MPETPEYRRCPKCGSDSFRRHGVHFDHERKCGACGHCWDPDEVKGKPMKYSFTEQDAQKAFDEWGCNCGPTALAFALQCSLDDVRGKTPNFEERRYTSPTMMSAAIKNLGKKFSPIFTGSEVSIPTMFIATLCPLLVRIQWTGPWTKPGANPKWAYRQTHWIACYRLEGLLPDDRCVFDCNGGMMPFARWEKEIVPLLTSTYPRADGGWFPTHVWKIK